MCCQQATAGLSAPGTDPRRRYLIKMQRRSKNKISEGCQGQLRTKRPSSLTGGWKSSYRSPLPVGGEVFFLTFPFIDQALTLTFPNRGGNLSAIGILRQLTSFLISELPTIRECCVLKGNGSSHSRTARRLFGTLLNDIFHDGQGGKGIRPTGVES